MTGAVVAVQAALVAALKAHPSIGNAVSGVFDGAPARAPHPYIVVDGGIASDWSHKTARGREQRVGIVIHDDARRPARLHTLMADAERAIEAMARALDDHRVASVTFLRSRVARDPAGPWAGLIEYRVRTIEVGA